MATLDDLFNEEEKARAEAPDTYSTPEAMAKRSAKSREEFERGVRLGWWTADGTPILQEEEVEEEE